MAALGFYEGKWQCQTFDYAAPNATKTPGPPATVRVARVLDGNWYKVELDLAPDATYPRGFHTQEFKGYDPETKKWVMVGMLSQPGAWVTFGSEGLIDNKMIWVPSKSEGKPSRGVMTRISDHEYDHVEEEDGGHGFAPTWSKHCMKQS